MTDSAAYKAREGRRKGRPYRCIVVGSKETGWCARAQDGRTALAGHGLTRPLERISALDLSGTNRTHHPFPPSRKSHVSPRPPSACTCSTEQDGWITHPMASSHLISSDIIGFPFISASAGTSQVRPRGVRDLPFLSRATFIWHRMCSMRDNPVD